MPKTEILFQGIIDNNFHLDAIKRISELDNISELIFCVAFARSEGIDLIFEVIDIDVSKIKFFLGVRNGITSAQALHELVKKDVEINCIDTGSSGVLFHSKIYLSSNAEQGYAVIGSANLTQSGLASNIETSFLLTFDFSDDDDKEIFNSLKNSVINIPVNHPDNCHRINNTRQIISLLWNGIISDERVVKKTNTTSKKKDLGSPVVVKPIQSYKKKIQRTLKGKSTREILKLKKKEISSENWILVWESKGLVRRDLTIPTSPNTNPTGSMYLKKGNTEDIDHRHYFRDVLFSELDWENDPPPKQHLERAYGKFDLVINGVDYGSHKLKLTHNSDTRSATYLEKNSMTQIHWGEVKKFIAKEALLGNILNIYKNVDSNDKYLIKISEE